MSFYPHPFWHLGDKKCITKPPTLAQAMNSVKIALDGDTLVVGARLEDSNATTINGDQTNNLAANAGAAYVFTRTTGTWSQQAYLKASNAQAGDEFGFRVALAGDTIAVSARNEDSNATGINGDQSDNSASNSGSSPTSLPALLASGANKRISKPPMPKRAMNLVTP